MALPISSCETERNFFKLYIIIKKKKQISINHARGKTELSFCSFYGNRYEYYKIVVMWIGDQRICNQKMYEKSNIEVVHAVN
jgi:hypothetical protein